MVAKKNGNTPKIEVALAIGAEWNQSVQDIKKEFEKTFSKPLEVDVDINRKAFDAKLTGVKSDLEALSTSKVIKLEVDEAKAVESVKNIGAQLTKYFSSNIKPINLDDMLNADNAVTNLKSLTSELKGLTTEYRKLLEVSSSINKAGKQMAAEQATEKQIQSMTGGVEAFITRLSNLSKAYTKFYEAADGKKLTPSDYGEKLVDQLRKMSELGKIEVGFIGTLSPETKASIKSELSTLSSELNAEGARIKVQAELVDYKTIDEQTKASPIPISVYPRIELGKVFKMKLGTEVATFNKEIKEDPGFQIHLGVSEESIQSIKTLRETLSQNTTQEGVKSPFDITLSDKTEKAITNISKLSKALSSLEKFSGENKLNFTSLAASLEGLKDVEAFKELGVTLSGFSGDGVKAIFDGIVKAMEEVAQKADDFNKKNGKDSLINITLSETTKAAPETITNLSTALSKLSKFKKDDFHLEELQDSFDKLNVNSELENMSTTLEKIAGVSDRFDAIAKAVKEIASNAAAFNSVMKKAPDIKKTADGQDAAAKSGKKTAENTSAEKKTAEKPKREAKVDQGRYTSAEADNEALKSVRQVFEKINQGTKNNPFRSAAKGVDEFKAKLDELDPTLTKIEDLIDKGDFKTAKEELNRIGFKNIISEGNAAIKELQGVENKLKKVKELYATTDDTGNIIGVDEQPFEKQFAAIINLRSNLQNLKKTISDSKLKDLGYEEIIDKDDKKITARELFDKDIGVYIDKLDAAEKKVKETLQDLKKAISDGTINDSTLKNVADAMEALQLAGDGTAKKLKAVRAEGERDVKVADRAQKAIMNIQKALENPRIKNTVFEAQLKQLLDRANKNTGSETAGINAELARINQQIGRAGLAVDTFGNKLIRTFSSRFRAAISSSGMFLVSQGFREIYQNVKDVDAAMTELRKVTEATNSEFVAFLDGATERAQKLGGSLVDVVSATADYSRLGYSLDEAASLADVAIMSKNVWDEVDNIDDVTSSLISTMKGFGIEAKNAIEISDKFNEV